MLGLEDCFERIISFETLNSTNKGTVLVDLDASESERPTELFDIDEYCSCPNADLKLPRTPVVCKPFEEAFEQVFKISNINPQKTVRWFSILTNSLPSQIDSELILVMCNLHDLHVSALFICNHPQTNYYIFHRRYFLMTVFVI